MIQSEHQPAGNPAQATSAIPVTGDLTTCRVILREMVKALRGPDGRAGNRSAALAVTKLEEACFWLGNALHGDDS